MHLFHEDGNFFLLAATFWHFSQLRPTRRNVFHEKDALCCIHCFKSHRLYMHLLYSWQLSHSALQWMVFWHTSLELVHGKYGQKLYKFSNIPAGRNRGCCLWRPRVCSVKNDSNVFPRHLIHTPGLSDWDNLSLASHDQHGVTSGHASEMVIERKPPPSSLLLLFLCWTCPRSYKLLSLTQCQKMSSYWLLSRYTKLQKGNW